MADAEARVAVVGEKAAAVQIGGDHPVPVDPNLAHHIPDQAAPPPTEDMVAARLRVGDSTVKTQSAACGFL